MSTPLDTAAAKGWIARVELRGYIVTEELIRSPTVAGQTTYYSRNFPITDSSYVLTDNENDVILYDDGVPVAAGNFTLTGSLGRIVFTVAPANDSVITLTYYFRRKPLAYGHAIDIRFNGGIEPLPVFSNRYPKELLDGIINLTGSLSRWHTDRFMWGLLMRDEGGDTYQPEFQLDLWPLGQYTGKPSLTLTGVKFSPGALVNSDPDSPQDENVDFTALALTTGVVT